MQKLNDAIVSGYSKRVISADESLNPNTQVRYVILNKPVAKDWTEFDNATKGGKKKGLRTGDVVDAKDFEDHVKRFEGRQGFEFPTVYEVRQRIENEFAETVGITAGKCWHCGQRSSYRVLADSPALANAEVCDDCYKRHHNLGFQMIDLTLVHKMVLAQELAALLKKPNVDLRPGDNGQDGLNPNAMCAMNPKEGMVTELDGFWGYEDMKDQSFFDLLKEAYGSEEVPSTKGMYLGQTMKDKFDKAGLSPLFLGGWAKSAVMGKLDWAFKAKGLDELSAEALKSFCRLTGKPIEPGEKYMVLGKSFGRHAGGKLSMSACKRVVFGRGWSDQLDDVHWPSREAAKHSAQKARELLLGTARKETNMALTSTSTTKGKASSGRKSGRHGR